jgi:polyhydroxybutyrate depolymerase
MQYSLILIAAFTLGQTEPLGAGDHKRTITVDKLKRTHWIHVPPKYDPKKPAPVVLALHGATMVGKLMEAGTGLSKTADDNNFIVVYPDGTGILPTWNAGLFPGEFNKVDDVKYLGKVLDDVEGALNVDRKRVYATGLSNGAMMCYRLASEMSDRIVCIAPVGGTMAIEKYEPKRPVPVMHFHGTKDMLVPFDGPPKNKKDTPSFLRFRSVDDTVTTCAKANGCAETPTETEVDVKEEKLKVMRKEYAGGKAKAEVILFTIENGGHTWPGSPFSPTFLGPSTKNFSANDAMWEFFKKHALK